MQTTLITGAAGFIGANFCHYFTKQHPNTKVIGLDILSYAGNLANLKPLENNPNFSFVHGDIGDTSLIQDLLNKHQITQIVNFAAESHVDRSITGPDAFIENNIVGTHNLLKAAKAVWLDSTTEFDCSQHRFHHISTDEVYGTLAADDPAFREDFAYQPNSPYSASKAASDHLVRAYHHTYGLNVTTSNCSNNYGPYHFPEKLIPLVITNILHNKALPIYGDGLQIRDWLYVDDHCQGIDLILQNGQVGECYNIGGNNEWANIDIVKLVCQLVDKAFADMPNLAQRYPQAQAAHQQDSQSLITYVEDRAGHDRRYAVDASKIMQGLGYKPQESFETGIVKTVTWYLENNSWWQAVLDGSYRS